MGAEAQSVEAAAELFRKANDMLGYVELLFFFSDFYLGACSCNSLFSSFCASFDLLDACTNGPKEKLDSTVISQVKQ